MRLLLDTDAFCKLAPPGLLDSAVRALGVDVQDLRRLPALPYMLGRGGLRKRLGEPVADRLIPVANGILPVSAPSSAWLDRLVGVDTIDPGEAQLLALAADNECLLLTGDKRALGAVKAVPGYAEALRLKVVLPEVVLQRLCDLQGDSAIRDAIQATGPTDVMMKVCFSTSNPTPRDSLRSYIAEAFRELNPLELWMPGSPRLEDAR